MLNGENLCVLPLMERKKKLREAVPADVEGVIMVAPVEVSENSSTSFSLSTHTHTHTRLGAAWRSL
jgi:hypothetical protein